MAASEWFHASRHGVDCRFQRSRISRRRSPPPNADMTLAPWFQGLRQPGTGISCCSMADCRPTDFRTNGSHYEAMIEGEWRVVPPHVILEQIENPTGHAVV